MNAICRCKIGRHPQVQQINRELIANATIRATSAKYGFSTTTVQHHRRVCLAKILQEANVAAAAARSEHGADLLADAVREQNEIINVAKGAAVYAKRDANVTGINQSLASWQRGKEHKDRLLGLAQPAATASSVHYHKHETVNVINSASDDLELAQDVREATDNWNPATIQRLMALAPPLPERNPARIIENHGHSSA